MQAAMRPTMKIILCFSFITGSNRQKYTKIHKAHILNNIRRRYISSKLTVRV